MNQRILMIPTKFIYFFETYMINVVHYKISINKNNKIINHGLHEV